MGTGEDLSGASPVAGERQVLPAASPAAPSQPSVPVPVPVPPRPRPAPDDAVPYGLRVTAGYAWRLVVVALAVYLVFVVLGTLTFVAVAVFAGLVITALLRPVRRPAGARRTARCCRPHGPAAHPAGASAGSSRSWRTRWRGSRPG